MASEAETVKIFGVSLPQQYSFIIWGYIRLIFILVTLCMDAAELVKTIIKIDVDLLFIHSYILAMSVLDFVYGVTFIVGIHKIIMKLRRAVYLYEIALYILQTLCTLLYIVMAIWLASVGEGELTLYHSCKPWRSVLSLTYYTGYIVMKGYILYLVKHNIYNAPTNCQFRFTKHSKEPECSLKMKTQQQGAEGSHAEETNAFENTTPNN